VLEKAPLAQHCIAKIAAAGTPRGCEDGWGQLGGLLKSSDNSKVKPVRAVRDSAGSRLSTRGRRPKVNTSDEVATRTAILDAALKTFSIHGFAGASIADIAREHPVSTALIHYYFSTKEELWRAALEHGIGDVLHNLEETIRDLTEIDSVARLKFFIRRYIAIVADRPEVFQVIIRESDTRGPRLTWLSKHYLTPLYSLFTQLVEAAQAEGKIKTIVPSYHLSQIIAGASYQFLASRNRMLETYGVDVLTKEEREVHTNAVLDILFTGMLTDSQVS
jgi:TetR/AcrR family transcriptional regulator